MAEGAFGKWPDIDRFNNEGALIDRGTGANARPVALGGRRRRSRRARPVGHVGDALGVGGPRCALAHSRVTIVSLDKLISHFIGGYAPPALPTWDTPIPRVWALNRV